jgi:hypothetical protein
MVRARAARALKVAKVRGGSREAGVVRSWVGPSPYSRLLLLIVTALTAPPAAAQVDPSGPWRTWHSEHFRIHARAELEDAARRAAREAERAYALLAGELEPPRGPIDLVVADNMDFSNGFATPFPSNRLTVFATPPAGTTSLDDYTDWLRLVITHELAHLFHLDPAHGVWGVMQLVFGRAPFAFPNTYQPSWVKEGLATYYESRFTGAGRVRSGFHRQLLASVASGGNWPAPGDLSFAGPEWPAGFGPYAWGAEFFALQAAGQGDSVVPGFARRTSRRLWPIAVSGPLEAAGGRPLDEAWERLRAGARPDASPRRRILVRGLRVEPGPRLSPDGSRVAYVVSRGRTPEYVEIRSVVGDTVLETQRVNGAPALAWVGDSLLLAQLDFTSPVTVRSDLYVWNGGRLTRLTRGARLGSPFALPSNGVGAVDVGAWSSRLVTVEGDSAVPLRAPEADVWSRVTMSPDGQRMAGARHRRGQWDLVVWPTHRPDHVQRLTDDAAVDEDPAWGPDGDLYFVSDRSGLPQVYRANVHTGHVRPVTSDPTGAREPVPLRGGDLLYVTLLGDGFAIVRGAPQVEDVADVLRARPPVTPAPDVALREGGYSPWPALRPWFWIPFGHDEGASGFFVGALTGGLDPIGRTGYAAAVTGNVHGATFRPELHFGLTHSRWRHWTLDLTARQSVSGVLGRLTTGGLIDLSELERTTELGLAYTWRRWRTAFGLRLGGELEDVRYVDARTGANVVSIPAVAGGVLSARLAHLQRPALAISPENGAALSGTWRHRWALDGSGTGDEVAGTVTTFLALPLPGFAHWVLALRAAGGVSEGPAAGTFGLGGVSGDVFEIIPGIALGSGRRSFPLRGYPRASGFTRVGAGAAELRIPLFLLSKGVWHLPVMLDRVSLSLFAEAGGGWIEGTPANLAQFRDVGGELVVDLGVAYDVPLRVRLGVAVPLAGGLGAARGDPRYYVTFGPSF